MMKDDVTKINFNFNFNGLVITAILLLSAGCGEELETENVHMLKANEHNVAKLRTCCVTFASEKDGRAPQSKEELIEFLNSEKVSKHLGRIGVSTDNLDAIFVSDRDSKPLKVKWGEEINDTNPQPIVFEAVGVDGVRLVAGADVLKVSDEDRYNRLWNGTAEPPESAEQFWDRVEQDLQTK